MIEPIELRFTVPCSPEHAFEVWTSRTSTWWPTSHSVSGDPDLTVTIGREVGGRILERTSQGQEHTWGEIIAWDPPDSFSYRWHLNQHVADATVVTISFVPFEGGTEVRIVRSGWERLGPAGPGLRERNDRGWAGVLPHFRSACAA